jgi:hypothetical protein
LDYNKTVPGWCLSGCEAMHEFVIPLIT